MICVTHYSLFNEQKKKVNGHVVKLLFLIKFKLNKKALSGNITCQYVTRFLPNLYCHRPILLDRKEKTPTTPLHLPSYIDCK